MIVMPADSSGFLMGWIAGQYPGRFAHLLNACCWRQNPFPFIPWAMDNGKFSCWTTGKEWNEDEFWRRVYEPYMRHPLWVVVPDCVADKDGTLREWERCYRRIGDKGHTLAFAVQDGMMPSDVPEAAQVIFVGGTTEWKWRNLPTWTMHFGRVHVGRVGSERMLWMAHNCGAESCDSTGWGREGYGSRRIKGLLHYLNESTPGKKRDVKELWDMETIQEEAQ